VVRVESVDEALAQMMKGTGMMMSLRVGCRSRSAGEEVREAVVVDVDVVAEVVVEVVAVGVVRDRLAACMFIPGFLRAWLLDLGGGTEGTRQ
jgi:hypothetical protein